MSSQCGASERRKIPSLYLLKPPLGHSIRRGNLKIVTAIEFQSTNSAESVDADLEVSAKEDDDGKTSSVAEEPPERCLQEIASCKTMPSTLGDESSKEKACSDPPIEGDELLGDEAKSQECILKTREDGIDMYYLQSKTFGVLNSTQSA